MRNALIFVVLFAATAVAHPPRVIYRPVQVQPYEYKETVLIPRCGPLRCLFFGRYRTLHLYAPQQTEKPKDKGKKW